VVGVSPSTASITTRVRTWLFVAGLTALLIGAGALAGGAFLYAFVALAVLMNLVGYLPRAGLATLFSTHPPIPERVRRLRGYEA
jgi:hypothetical protein